MGPVPNKIRGNHSYCYAILTIYLYVVHSDGDSTGAYLDAKRNGPPQYDVVMSTGTDFLYRSG